MTKQHKKISIKPEWEPIQKELENLLSSIGGAQRTIKEATENYNAWIAPMTKVYQEAVTGMQTAIDEAEKELIALMKKNKGVLFSGTDVVNLAPGSLIRNIADKVSIPHGALDACKENGFKEVIKIVESLDRAAIEKWPDARLVLIGAERKPVEEFKYNIKK